MSQIRDALLSAAQKSSIMAQAYLAQNMCLSAARATRASVGVFETDKRLQLAQHRKNLMRSRRYAVEIKFGNSGAEVDLSHKRLMESSKLYCAEYKKRANQAGDNTFARKIAANAALKHIDGLLARLPSTSLRKAA